MRFLLTMGIVALASCGPPTRNSAVRPTDGGSVRLHVTDAVSGAPLAARASGTNASCLPNGQTCFVQFQARPATPSMSSRVST